MSGNRLLTLAVALALAVPVALVVLWQVRLAVPFASGDGPIEWLDTALLGVLAAGCAAIASFWRGARRMLWWTAAAGFAIVALLSVGDLLPGTLPAIDNDDYPMLGGWAIAAAVLLIARRSPAIGRQVRITAGVGFVLHSAAMAFDLVDTGALARFPAFAGEMVGTRELVELLYLGAYCFAAIVLAGSVMLRAFAQPSAARHAGLGVPAWLERRLGSLFRRPSARKLRIFAEELRWRRWQKRNPGRSFADYYGAQIAATLRQGQPHRTLGTTAYSLDAMIAGKGKWSPGEFTKRGVGKFEAIRDWNLEPEETLIDYGCGSLRVGQHLIRYLDPGKYTGIDITDVFYKDGIEMLEPGLVEAKAPRFGVIGEALIDRLALDPPDVVLSVAVVMHIPPQELERYFDRVLRLIGPHTRAMIHVDVAERELRTAPKSWAYPIERFRQIVAQRRPELSFDLQLAEFKGSISNVQWRHGTILLQNPASKGHAGGE
jgi:SAM-dependent methyltransferase